MEIKKILRLAVPVVIFFFLGRLLFSRWNQIKEYSWSLDFPLLLLSFLFLMATLFFAIILWKNLLNRLGACLTFFKSFEIFYLSSLGKYVPGKIWQFIGMYYMLEKEKTGMLQAVSSILWVNIFFNLSGILLGAITIYATGMEIKVIPLPALAFIALAGLLLIQPKVINKILFYFTYRFGKSNAELSLPFTAIINNLFLYGLLWVCYGIGFFLMARSVYTINLEFMPIFIGCFALAHIAGYISFLSPGGLGVREGVLTYLLSFFMPLAFATLISLLARVWLLAGELLCALIALKLKNRD